MRRDALAALIQIFNTLAVLRQRLPAGAHIQGIITRGGTATNTVFGEHIAPLGITMTAPEPGIYLGSSDIGNVSAVVPAMHPFVAITGPDQPTTRPPSRPRPRVRPAAR